jgi:hypothetical protein
MRGLRILFTRHLARCRTAPVGYIAAILLGVGLCGGIRTAHAQFTDTFSSVISEANWSNSSETWSVDSGTYGSLLTDQGPQGDFVFSTLQASGYTNLTNFTFSFDMLGAMDAGAVIRSNADGSDSLTVILRPAQGDFYFIRRFGDWMDMVSTTAFSEDYQEEDLRVTITADGDDFTASAALLSSPDTPLATINANINDFAIAPSASGRVGLYQYAVSTVASRFDNVNVDPVVTSTAAPEPGTLGLIVLAGLPVAGGIVRRRRAASVA